MKFAKDHDSPEDAVLMQKVNVNGKNADENWKLLKAAFNNKDVFWNFEKFLVALKNCNIRSCLKWDLGKLHAVLSLVRFVDSCLKFMVARSCVNLAKYRFLISAGCD